MTDHAVRPTARGDSPPSTYRKARRKAGRWRRKVLDPGNLTQRQEKLRSRLDQQAKQITELKLAVATMKPSVAQVKSAGAETKSTLAALAKRLRTVELATLHREREHGNLTIQVGICEERLGRIEERLRDEHLTAGPAEEVEARRLIDEVRREHEQVRVRMQVIGQYEERLRRLEAAAVDLHGDDVRHPI